jgi:hypothetical protein
MSGKRGQIVLVGIMIAMLVFTMVAALIPSIKSQVVQTRSDLGCNDGNLTAYEEGTCIINDSYLFFFVGVSLAVGLAYIGAKRLGFVGG